MSESINDSVLEALKLIAPDGFEAKLESSGLDPSYTLYFVKTITFDSLRNSDAASDLVLKISEEIAEAVTKHPGYQKLLQRYVEDCESYEEGIGLLESEIERLRKFESYYNVEHSLRHGGDLK